LLLLLLLLLFFETGDTSAGSRGPHVQGSMHAMHEEHAMEHPPPSHTPFCCHCWVECLEKHTRSK